MKTQDIYEKITNKVIEKLEQGIIPWRKPWGRLKQNLPLNLITKKRI